MHTTDDKPFKGRQAVVIIHGLGEQRPMATLRSFVDSLTGWLKDFDDTKDRPRYWSRPDGISDFYETRRITMEATSQNPKTDFYEFYWAHHMRNTSLRQLFSWVVNLFVVREVPPRLILVKWLLATILCLLAALLLLLPLWLIRSHRESHLLEPFSAFASVHPLATLVLLGLAAFGLWLLGQALHSQLRQSILNTAGDAARYFNPTPDNIDERSAIRREGITFLKRLHSRTEKPYDRIIIVGHSLGSVIAYDLIRLLWHEMHEVYTPTTPFEPGPFTAMDALANDYQQRQFLTTDVDSFQELQQQCWQQHRANGNPWLITDFVSCAGAIAHADLYLFNKVPFDKLIQQKEFPVCPPVMEGADKTLFFDGRTHLLPRQAGHKIKKRTWVNFLNHGAPFAITRWTNIYFTSDFVGSSGQRKFRQGVKDIEIDRPGFWLFPSGHTNYWDAAPDNKALDAIARAIGFSKAQPQKPTKSSTN